MSYSNKIFNVNGIGDSDLLSTLKLASKDAPICGYTVDNEVGLRIYFSKSFLPDVSIINESSKNVLEEFNTITTYLKELGNAIAFTTCDNVNEKMIGKNDVEYVMGWRVYVELQTQDDMEWWDHCIVVRPSYIIK